MDFSISLKNTLTSFVLLCSALSVSVPSLAHAFSEVTVLSVTSDSMDGTYKLNLVLDDQFDLLSAKGYKDDGSSTPFSLSQLEAGAVLLNQSGYDIAKVTATNFSPTTGGAIDLNYLSSAITGSYDDFPMTLVRNGNVWTFQTDDSGQPRDFSSMFLVGRKFFGKLIGIKEIQVQ